MTGIISAFGQDQQGISPEAGRFAEYPGLADSLHGAGQFDSALVLLEEMLLHMPRDYGAEDSVLFKKALDLWLAIVQNLLYKADYDKAYDHLQWALDQNIRSPASNRPIDDKCFHLIGNIYYYKGRIEDALANFNKALEVRLAAYGQKHTAVANSYHNLGVIYLARGNYDKALEFFNKALYIRLELLGQKHPDITGSYNNIALVHQYKGDNDQALLYHQKSLDLKLELLGARHPSVMESQINIGNIYDEKGMHESARTYYQKALNRQLEYYDKDHPNVGHLYLSIGTSYHREGDNRQALAYLRKSGKIFEHCYGDKHRHLTRLYNTFGQIRIKENDYSRALDNFQRAIIAGTKEFSDTAITANPSDNDLTSIPELLAALSHKAESLAKKNSGQGDLALDTYILAASLIANMRQAYQTTGAKLDLGQEARSVYDKAITVALQLYRLTASEKYRRYALEFAEKSKAMVMLEMIKDIKARHFGEIPDSLLIFEKEIRTQLNHQEVALLKEKNKKTPKDSLRIVQQEEEIFALKRSYEKLIEDLEHHYPSYYALKYQSETAGFEQIQSKLGEDEAMIEYFTGDSQLLIIGITKTDILLRSLPKGGAFGEQVRQYVGAIKKADPTKYIQQANELYQYLLEPVTELIHHKKRLIIIPDGILFYVPFEALLTASPARYEKDYSRLAYLAKDFEVSYHYSATLYLEQDPGPAGSPGSPVNFTGFAPVFDQSNEKIVYTGDTDPVATAGAPVPATLVHGKKLYPLPHSETEVRSIVDQFIHRQYIGVGYLYQAATEGNFKQEAPGYRYIQIATHSIVDEEMPDLSGIVFANPQTLSAAVDSPQNEDGILYAGEIFNLDLNRTDLVVLSSCESGIGKLVKGEGLMAMTRGFLYAGVDNIIYSLWKVDDRQTRKLMGYFYENLLADNNYARSLQMAKLSMIRDPATALPRHWSGFVLMGK